MGFSVLLTPSLAARLRRCWVVVVVVVVVVEWVMIPSCSRKENNYNFSCFCNKKNNNKIRIIYCQLHVYQEVCPAVHS